MTSKAGKTHAEGKKKKLRESNGIWESNFRKGWYIGDRRLEKKKKTSREVDLGGEHLGVLMAI